MPSGEFDLRATGSQPVAAAAAPAPSARPQRNILKPAVEWEPGMQRDVLKHAVKPSVKPVRRRPRPPPQRAFSVGKMWGVAGSMIVVTMLLVAAVWGGRRASWTVLPLLCVMLSSLCSILTMTGAMRHVLSRLADWTGSASNALLCPGDDGYDMESFVCHSRAMMSGAAVLAMAVVLALMYATKLA